MGDMVEYSIVRQSHTI